MSSVSTSSKSPQGERATNVALETGPQQSHLNFTALLDKLKPAKNYGEVTTVNTPHTYRLLCTGERNLLYLLLSDLTTIHVIHDPNEARSTDDIVEHPRPDRYIKLVGEHLYDPRGMVYSRGRIFIADRSRHQVFVFDLGDEETGNSKRSTRKAELTCFAGSGEPGDEDGEARSASFFGPFDITADRNGTLFIADEVIRQITQGRVLTTCGNTDIAMNTAAKLAHQASFLDVHSLCTSVEGLYCIDQFAIRRVSLIGKGPVVNNFSGKGNFQGFRDGDVDEALFFNPSALQEGIDGRLYVGDGPRLRVVTPGHDVPLVTTLAGSLQYRHNEDDVDGIGEECGFGSITSLAISSNHEHLYILHDDISVGNRGGGKLRKMSILDQLTALFRALDINVEGCRKLTKRNITTIKQLADLPNEKIDRFYSEDGVKKKLKNFLDAFREQGADSLEGLFELTPNMISPSIHAGFPKPFPYKSKTPRAQTTGQLNMRKIQRDLKKELKNNGVPPHQIPTEEARKKKRVSMMDMFQDRSCRANQQLSSSGSQSQSSPNLHPSSSSQPMITHHHHKSNHHSPASASHNSNQHAPKSRQRRSKTMPVVPNPAANPSPRTPTVSIPSPDSDDDNKSAYSLTFDGSNTPDSRLSRLTFEGDISPPRTPGTPNDVPDLSPIVKDSREKSKKEKRKGWGRKKHKKKKETQKEHKHKKKGPVRVSTSIVHDDIEGVDDEFLNVNVNLADTQLSPERMAAFSSGDDISDLPPLNKLHSPSTGGSDIDSEQEDVVVAVSVTLETVTEDSREQSRSEGAVVVGTVIYDDSDYDR